MRILVAQPGPGFSVADVYVGWVEALQDAGQHVSKFNLDDRLAFYSNALFPAAGEDLGTAEPGSGIKVRPACTGEQAIELAVNGLYSSVMRNRPHVLMIVSAFFTPPELLETVRAAGVKVVVVHTESPYEDERQLAIAAHADLNLVNDPTNLEAFRQLGPAEYFPHAYRPSVHHPGPADPVYGCDLAFVGTGFPSRVEFFEAMSLDGIRVALAGNWALLGEGSKLADSVIHERADECFDNAEAAALYRSAKVGLNLYRREARENDTAEGWACGPREIEMAACQLPFARDPRPESDGLFPFLPTFSTPDEAVEQVRWLLNNDRLREDASIKAREAVADRTFDQHVVRLLRLLDA